MLLPWLLVPSALALLATLIGCVRHARASKVDDVAAPGEVLRYRTLILWLHFVQPWARLRGRVKGYFSDANFTNAGLRLLGASPRLTVVDTRSDVLHSKSLWDTRYTATDDVLNGLGRKAAGALTPVRCDDGFGGDHDGSARGPDHGFKFAQSPPRITAAQTAVQGGFCVSIGPGCQ